MLFKLAHKVAKCLGNFKKIFLPRTFLKIAQSGHTARELNRKLEREMRKSGKFERIFLQF